MTARPQPLDGAYPPRPIPVQPSMFAPDAQSAWQHDEQHAYQYDDYGHGHPSQPPPPSQPSQAVPQTDDVSSPQDQDEVDLQTLNLWSLQDGEPGKKPPYPYPTIILCALKGSPKGRLTLDEMYKAIEDRFPFYVTYKPYRNSVRHNLSLNSMFVKVPRPITDPGKGCYWTIKKGAEIGVSAGTKRERKRNKKPAAATVAALIAATKAARPPSLSPSPPPAQVLVPVPVALPPRSHEDEYPEVGRQRHFRYIRVEDRAAPVQGATAYGDTVSTSAAAETYTGGPGPQRTVRRRRKSPPVAPYPTPYASSSSQNSDEAGPVMLEEYESRPFDESYPQSPPPQERYMSPLPIDEHYPTSPTLGGFAPMPVHLPPTSPPLQYAPPPPMRPPARPQTSPPQHYAPPSHVSPPRHYEEISPPHDYAEIPSSQRYVPVSPPRYAPVSPPQHYAAPPMHPPVQAQVSPPQQYAPPPQTSPPHQYEQVSPPRPYVAPSQHPSPPLPPAQVSPPHRYAQAQAPVSPPHQYAPPTPSGSPPTPIALPPTTVTRPPPPPPIPAAMTAPLPTFGSSGFPSTPFTPNWSFSNPTGSATGSVSTTTRALPQWNWK